MGNSPSEPQFGGYANYQMFDYSPSAFGGAARRDTNDRSRGGKLISHKAERALLAAASRSKRGSAAARRHLKKLVHVTPLSKLYKNKAARRKAASVRRSLRRRSGRRSGRR
jgi:hypothetical protein